MVVTLGAGRSAMVLAVRRLKGQRRRVHEQALVGGLAFPAAGLAQTEAGSSGLLKQVRGSR